MGFAGSPTDTSGEGMIMKDAPDGDFTEPPEAVERFLQR